jgi:hypothetical protein
MDEKGWLDRKLDEQDEYRKKFSAWDDFRFGVLGPAAFLGLIAFALLAVYALLAAIF